MVRSLSAHAWVDTWHLQRVTSSVVGRSGVGVHRAANRSMRWKQILKVEGYLFLLISYLISNYFFLV